jgi:hypothetical protein
MDGTNITDGTNCNDGTIAGHDLREAVPTESPPVLLTIRDLIGVDLTRRLQEKKMRSKASMQRMSRVSVHKRVRRESIPASELRISPKLRAGLGTTFQPSAES